MVNIQYNGAAEFKLLQSSALAPAMSAKDPVWGQTQVLIIHQIKRIDCHPATSDGYSVPETIIDTETWLDWNWDLYNPNDSKDDWEADNESEIELDKCIQHPETAEEQDTGAAPNVPKLIWPT